MRKIFIAVCLLVTTAPVFSANDATTISAATYNQENASGPTAIGHAIMTLPRNEPGWIVYIPIYSVGQGEGLAKAGYTVTYY